MAKLALKPWGDSGRRPDNRFRKARLISRRFASPSACGTHIHCPPIHLQGSAAAPPKQPAVLIHQTRLER
jgi:hypothetical protein